MTHTLTTAQKKLLTEIAAAGFLTVHGSGNIRTVNKLAKAGLVVLGSVLALDGSNLWGYGPTQAGQDELNAITTKIATKPVKQEAQDAILHAAMAVFYHLSDDDASPELVEETHRQINRIEKLFGYEPGTWRS